jgi:NADH:ubiquinone oxidoreductase subunit 6 (subunit J)
MKTKQLLEIALKIVGILYVIPTLLSLPFNLYTGTGMFTSYSGSSIPWFFLFSVALYIFIIYYLIFNTEKVVNYIYKEKEDEKELSLNINRTTAIFFAIVLASLIGLVISVPPFAKELFVQLKQKISFNPTIETYGYRMDENYFVVNGIEIVLLILALLNANKITAWIVSYGRKKMGNTTEEIEN